MGFVSTIRRAVKSLRHPPKYPGVTLREALAQDAMAAEKPKRIFSPAAMSDLGSWFAQGGTVGSPWSRKPEKPAWVKKWLSQQGGQVRLAMDEVPFEEFEDYAMNSSPWSEGLGFLGYAYLSELQQRPEFRRISEIWAAECTRKWIKLKGDNPERIAKLEKLMRDFGVREKFREAIELDGSMGRAHIFMDFGDAIEDRAGPLEYTPETIPVGSLVNLKVTEPFWTYPLTFNTQDPLADDYYVPSQWQVMSCTVHNSRLLTFVGRELPDILKPVYMFGGLSLSQMAKPYVDNFIKNRTSASNLLYSFSTMVLSTNMGAMLTPGGAKEVIERVSAFVFGRDSGGLMLVDKETEELTNVSAPLGGVDKLLAQAQEFISSVVGIPLTTLLGTTPAGLNASSDGELTSFHDHIQGYNEKTCQAPLTTLLIVLQLHLDGTIDESLTFEFLNLTEMSETDKAAIRLSNMTVATGYINAGVLDPADERTRLENEEGGLWYGIKLQEPPPPADYNDEGEEGEEDDDGKGEADNDDDKPGIAKLRKAANDAILAFANGMNGSQTVPGPLVQGEPGSVSERSGNAEVAADDDALAAGVLFTLPDGRFLLLQRGDGGDHPGEWAYPGGKVDGDETSQEAAFREVLEETGHDLDKPLGEPVHTRGKFTTFQAALPEPFIPELNEEHTGYIWASMASLPQPMHPGALETLVALDL